MAEKRKTAKERAYEHVKSCIINETYKQDSFLTEEEVAQDLGVSRTPVREAFLLLEAEGFVNLFSQRGAYIPSISPRDMEEVMETRLLIESFAAERFLIAAQAIKEMKFAIKEQEYYLEIDDVEPFIDCDAEFHNLIVNAAGNRLLTEIYSGLRNKLLRMGVRAVMNSTERMQQVIEEHRTIVKEAEAGELAGLKTAIQKHLATTLSVLLQHNS